MALTRVFSLSPAPHFHHTTLLLLLLPPFALPQTPTLDFLSLIPTMPATQPVHVCILGAGIMGISTAYYLLHDSNLPPNSTVTLIDNVGIAPGASSRAAGFIAASWHPHTTLPLGELSFRLFEDLDKAHQGRARWEWRLLNAVGLHVGGKDEHMSAYRTLPVGETLDKLDRDWLQGERVSLQGGRTAAV